MTGIEFELVALMLMLAREELRAAELAKQEAARFAYEAAAQVEMREKVAHAMGEMEGQAKMAEAIAQAVAQRMGGGDDLVTPEDLARAKRGMVH